MESKPATHEQPLYDAGRQRVKVRTMMIFSLACAAGALWWGIDLAQHYGLSPGDGGVLAPLPARLAWGVGVAALGLIFAGGMWLYGQIYVSRLFYEPEQEQLIIHTLELWGNRRHSFHVSQIERVRRHAGRMQTYGVDVNAPWRDIHIRGRRLAFILDDQGEVLDAQMLGRLLG